MSENMSRCLIGMEACVGASRFKTAVYPDRDWIRRSAGGSRLKLLAPLRGLVPIALSKMTGNRRWPRRSSQRWCRQARRVRWLWCGRRRRRGR